MGESIFFQTNRNLDIYNKNNSFFHANQTKVVLKQKHNLGLRFGTSKMHLSPPPLLLQWLRQLSILGRWFCCCRSIAYCYSHCLRGGGGGGCVWSLFCYSVLCVLLVVQAPLWGKESWLLYFNCVPDVLWLLVFYRSSSWYHVLVYSV